MPWLPSTPTPGYIRGNVTRVGTTTPQKATLLMRNAQTQQRVCSCVRALICVRGPPVGTEESQKQIERHERAEGKSEAIAAADLHSLI